MAMLGGTATGTVDATYVADDILDGDISNPIKRTGDLSLALTGTAVGGSNGAVVAGHLLNPGTTVSLTGDKTASIITSATTPPDGIPLNAGVFWDPAVSVSNLTIAITGHSGAIYIGGFFVGRFQELRALGPGAALNLTPMEVPYVGEYGGLSQDREAPPPRRYGGRVWLTDTQAGILNDWFLGCKNNSLPSIIVPFPQRDPWVVKWTQYSLNPTSVDVSAVAAWEATVEWEELPRYRWP